MSTTAFTDVRIFDGYAPAGPTSLVTDYGVITQIGPGVTAPPGAEIVSGGMLLPGLIDAHVHPAVRANLDALATHGVTTAFDMASWPSETTVALRIAKGTTNILSAGVPVIGPAGPHSHFGMPEYAILTDPGQVDAGIGRRLVDGADYIKIVVEPPGSGGPDPEIVAAVVRSTHTFGRKVVAHAAHIDAFTLAFDAGADVITHVPVGTAVGPELARRMAEDGRVAIPTLSVAEVLTAGMRVPGTSYDVARDSVVALREAGVPVLAGTDSVEQPGVPFSIPMGTTLHHELELLVGAGYTPVEALRAATELPATTFGLGDRGSIGVGQRADLILVDGDPTVDITATRDIRGVWIGGERIG